MTVVHRTQEFEKWFRDLDGRDQATIIRVVSLLMMKGVTLGEPHSSALRGTRYPLRELRPRSGASPLRVLYAFDPRREAWVLVGGSKAAEANFYGRAIARAEAIWESHLARLKTESPT